MPTTGPRTILHVGYSHTLGCIARDLLVGLKQEGWRIQVACPEDEWADRLREDGFHVWPIRFPHRPGVAQAFVGARDLLATLRTQEFGAVHTHNAHHGVVGRHLGRGMGLPVFHTWRYDPLDASDSRIQRVIYGVAEGSASRLTRRVMFQNEEDLELAVSRRIVPQHRAVLVGNGIVTERYAHPTRPPSEVRKELRLPDDAKVITCVARIVERKGQPDLVRALRMVAGEHPDVQLLLVGEGPDDEDVRALAERLGVLDRIHFVGQRDDIADVLHASDVLCLPSRREGVPRAVMEAMAAGVPVVATNVVGTRSVIKDGRTGFLVPYQSPPALAGALARVLGDPTLAERITSAAAEVIARDWHQRVVVKRVAREYEGIVPQSDSARLRERRRSLS